MECTFVQLNDDEKIKNTKKWIFLVVSILHFIESISNGLHSYTFFGDTIFVELQNIHTKRG